MTDITQDTTQDATETEDTVSDGAPETEHDPGFATDSTPEPAASFEVDPEPEPEVEQDTEEPVEVIQEDDLFAAVASPAEASADGVDVDDLLASDDEEEDDDEDDDGGAPPVESPYDRPGAWYVVHTYAGYENKVKQNLASMVASLNLEDRVYEVVIPMEDVIDFKGGKRVVVQKKMFPGYLLVRLDMDENVWFHIRNTPGVTGFVGQGAKPTPLSRRDVETFLAVKVEGAEPSKKTRPRTLYAVGESVRVKEGPFADFSGQIADINEDQLKVRVLVNIFGRETPVELGFDQVAKL